MSAAATANPLTNDLSRALGVDYPIFGFAHSVEATAAITLAGGFGVYGATRDTPQEITDRLARIRELVGARPFGVDLVLPRGMPASDDRALIEAEIPDDHRRFVADLYKKYDVPAPSGPGMRSRFVRSEETAEAQVRAVLESDVDLFACGIGAPPDAVAQAKADGKRTLALVGSPHHAERALAAGADMLVAQGHDAGAHTGPIGTFTLVPQIVDLAGSVPVLAAGGVATGRHIIAAQALGAAGVWLGTAWLATREYGLSETMVEKLLAAESADAVISRADSGKTLRQIRTAWSEEWARPDAPAPLKMPFQDILVGDLLGAIDTNDVKPLVHYPAGQSIAFVREVNGVADVMARLVNEATNALNTMAVGH
jgi:NAD(P)H-dependent flavin oxidoreductase YrpB (nitropropane dioxygenase family)